MKIAAAGLRDFLSLLPQYERLPLEARRSLASIERPSQSCSSYILGASLGLLIDTGFVMPPTPNGRCVMPPASQEFIRILRLLRRHPIFRKPGQATFDVYMAEHFTNAERDALRRYATAVYTERTWILFHQVTSPDWVEEFLNAENGDWEHPYLALRTEELSFSNAEIFSTTQGIIRWLKAYGGHVPIRDILAQGRDPEVWSKALHASLRYALLFASLDEETMEPIVGVWPAVLEDKSVPAAPPPQSVAPAETFDPLFLVEDMTALLVACGAGPFKLRANDSQLFAKTVRELAESLRPLPKWVEDGFDIDAEARVDTTVAYLRTFGMVEEKGYPPIHMAINARGRKWLGLSMGDRLRVLIDGVLNGQQAVAAFEDFEGAQIGVIPGGIHVNTRMKSPPDIPASAMQQFRSLQSFDFFPIEEIVASSRTVNPLLTIFQQDKHAYFSTNYGYLNHPDEEQLQKMWIDLVHNFLRARLLPLGCVRVGRSKSQISIALTPVGRYFLGQAKKWAWSIAADSQIIVQPNFDVTFLGESPAAEAELGRFAERRGRQMGALFQITKKSVFAAAASDMTPEAVFEILDRVCTREVPGNVRREIQGWFGQCRKVSFESVMLIRCPDRETALRVVGLAKGSAVPLSDTVLEYKDPGKQRAALIKKLREMGVIVSVDEKAVEKRTPRPQRRWGRW